MRPIALAALVAAGVAGPAGALTITSSWYERGVGPGTGEPSLIIHYDDPTIVKTPPAGEETTTDAWKTWSGAVSFSLVFEGVEYSGTGTSKGDAILWKWGVEGTQYTSYREVLLGTLEDGRTFRFSAGFADYEIDPAAFKAQIEADTAIWTFGYNVPDIDDSKIQFGDVLFDDVYEGLYGGVEHVSIAQVSPVPLPAGATLLLSGAGVLTLVRRRRAA